MYGCQTSAFIDRKNEIATGYNDNIIIESSDSWSSFTYLLQKMLYIFSYYYDCLTNGKAGLLEARCELAFWAFWESGKGGCYFTLLYTCLWFLKNKIATAYDDIIIESSALEVVSLIFYKNAIYFLILLW